MTVSTFYSSTDDGYVTGNHISRYTDARSTPVSTSTAATTTYIGQAAGIGFTIYKSYFYWDTSAVNGDTASSVVLSLWGTSDQSTTDFTAEARAKTWSGGGLTTGDWDTEDGGTLLATLSTSGFSTSGYNAFTDVAFTSAINGSGNTEIIVVSDRTVSAIAPTVNEYILVSSADETGTTQDPKLVVTHAAVPPPAWDEATEQLAALVAVHW